LTRKVFYITGTRADFGLMAETLQVINSSKYIDLSIIVTGTHLSKEFSYTVKDIYASKIKICKKIYVENQRTNDAQITPKNIAKIIHELSTFFKKNKPDILVLLGDRGEMLGGAIAAIHQGINIVHIHGGERSGTIDESVRHAISKLSHYHFVSNADSKNRLEKMGEKTSNIYNVGAPGLVNIKKNLLSMSSLYSLFKLQSNLEIALFIYHPVPEYTNNLNFIVINNIFKVLLKLKIQIIVLYPNSDAGSLMVKKYLDYYKENKLVRFNTNLDRKIFLSFMKHSKFMIGNSSSGIIEAASFDLPVINIGLRQNLRARNRNVYDLSDKFKDAELEKLVIKLLNQKKLKTNNIYYKVNTSLKITKLLESLNIEKNILNKINTY